MTPNEQLLATFEARVRQLILAYQQLKKENADLYDMLDQREKQVQQLQQQLRDQTADQERLRLAKMLTITDGGLQQAKDRLSALTREVNKCIALLKEAQ